jgi:hypothetical protein
LRAGVLLATSVDGEALVLASMTDAGVELARLQRDGGSVVRIVPEWTAIDRLQLGGTLAAASLGGSVQLALLEDAGAPAVIALATDFELEARGRALALPTAILEPRTGALLRDAGPGPLSALLAPSDSVLVGVPRDQPGPPVVFPNLLVDDRLELFATAPLPRLNQLTGTVHEGRVVLGGATGFQLWALTSTGARTLELRPVQVQVASGPGARFGVAWQVEDQVSAALFCNP